MWNVLNSSWKQEHSITMHRVRPFYYDNHIISENIIFLEHFTAI